MGLSFFIGEIQAQTSEAVKMGNEYIQHAGTLRDSINHFLEAPLSSATYDSAKLYFMTVYPSLSNALILAGESLRKAHTDYLAKFQEIVGGGDVEEDRLLDQIQQGNGLLRAYAEVLNKLEKPNMHFEKAYMRTQEAIGKLEEKLEDLYVFNSISPAIFADAENNLDNLERAIAALNQGNAWNPSTGTFILTGMDMSWAKPIQIKWKEREQLLQEKESNNLGVYEIRPTPGQDGMVRYEVYINDKLDVDATNQYKVYLALRQHQEMIDNPLTFEEKLLVTSAFVGAGFFFSGSFVTITSVKGFLEGMPVFVLSNGGTAMMAQPINVSSEIITTTAETILITSAGAITIAAFSKVSDADSFDNLMKGNVDYAALHMKPDPTKPMHSQFNFTEKQKLIDLIREAWGKRGISYTEKFTTIYEIEMGKTIGTNGETKIRIVVDIFGQLLSSYPIL